MSYRHYILRAADMVASASLARSSRKPTYYLGRFVWLDAPQWQSLYSRYEHDVGQAIRTNLPRGGTFWDVGANIGWFSMYAATLTSRSGSVLSFEPSPEVVKLLRRNAAAYPKIQVFDCAIGSTNGTKTFAAQGTSSAASLVESVTQINSRHQPGEPIQQIPVSVRTLDEIAYETGSIPDLIKIDIEGYELEALKGARNLLQHKPRLIIEIHPRQLALSGGSEAELLSALREYQIQTINRNPNSLYTILAT